MLVIQLLLVLYPTKCAYTDVPISKNFQPWYRPTTGEGDSLPDAPPTRPAAVYRGESAPGIFGPLCIKTLLRT